MTAEYHGDGEHTHAQRTPPIAAAALIGVVILAIAVLALALYLAARVRLAEQLNRQTTVNALHDRQAICSVLLSIPPKHRSKAIRHALDIDQCDTLRLPPAAPPHIATSPSGHRGQASQPPVVVVPSRTVIVKHTTTPRSRPSPRPTVTRTRTAEPQPSHSPTPTPHPSETCLNPPNPLPKVCR